MDIRRLVVSAMLLPVLMIACASPSINGSQEAFSETQISQDPNLGTFSQNEREKALEDQVVQLELEKRILELEAQLSQSKDSNSPNLIDRSDIADNLELHSKTNIVEPTFDVYHDVDHQEKHEPSAEQQTIDSDIPGYFASTSNILSEAARVEGGHLISKGWNSPTKIETTYMLASDLGSDSLEEVKRGIDVVEDYLGIYGPYRVYIVGTDEEEAQIMAEDYCEWAYDRQDFSHCMNDQGVAIKEIAHYKGANAFAQHSHHLEKPNQSFVIGNPLQIGVGFGSKVAAHETVHIYQNAHHVYRFDPETHQVLNYDSLPRWLEEGSAEFLALYLSDKEGWVSFRQMMEEAMGAVHELRGEYPQLSIRDLHDEESTYATEKVCDYCVGRLQYEFGQWATALLVEKSSIDILYKKFIPEMHLAGRDSAFKQYFGLTIEEFYAEFELFLELDINAQMKILPK